MTICDHRILIWNYNWYMGRNTRTAGLFRSQPKKCEKKVWDRIEPKAKSIFDRFCRHLLTAFVGQETGQAACPPPSVTKNFCPWEYLPGWSVILCARRMRANINL